MTLSLELTWKWKTSCLFHFHVSSRECMCFESAIQIWWTSRQDRRPTPALPNTPQRVAEPEARPAWPSFSALEDHFGAIMVQRVQTDKKISPKASKPKDREVSIGSFFWTYRGAGKFGCLITQSKQSSGLLSVGIVHQEQKHIQWKGSSTMRDEMKGNCNNTPNAKSHRPKGWLQVLLIPNNYMSTKKIPKQIKHTNHRK